MCLFGCIGSCLGKACTACCCKKGGGKSTSFHARIGSSIVLILITVLALLAETYGYKWFKNWPYKTDVGSCSGSLELCSARLLTVKIGIVGFTFFTVLLLFSLLNCCVKYRGLDQIQNGYWCWKIMALILLVIAAYFIPPKAAVVFFYIFLVVGAFFIVFQSFLIITSLLSWNAKFVDHDWEVGLWILFGVACAVAVVLIVFTWILFHGCGLAIALNIVTLVVGIGIVVFSFFSHYASVFTSASVACYCLFLNIASLASSPNANCCSAGLGTGSRTALNWVVKIVSFVITFLLMIWMSFSRNQKITNGEEEEIPRCFCPCSDSGDIDEEDDASDSEPSQFSYWKLNVLFLSACANIVCVATGWSLADGVGDAGIGTTALWVKTASNWLSYLLYIWVLINPYVGPIICPDRDWGED
ncbi:putative Serine incorporator (Serinc) [Blattamonas nauphoetae]|uniref:Serine incorporator (Serinc) n=1 Tax=Blattamonas nauphoetae TaxID=2049346 RepID=A0ABQ9YGH7_9EUKA|nr:putative Serine incorporator (Serinc) [Blattamonas nauphoetae]